MLATYNQLMQCESRKLGGGKSSLALFLRMDVGLYIDGQGVANYFVNEVERTVTTSLWVKTTGVPPNSLAQTFGECLGEWMEAV